MPQAGPLVLPECQSCKLRQLLHLLPHEAEESIKGVEAAVRDGALQTAHQATSLPSNVTDASS